MLSDGEGGAPIQSSVSTHGRPIQSEIFRIGLVCQLLLQSWTNFFPKLIAPPSSPMRREMRFGGLPWVDTQCTSRVFHAFRLPSCNDSYKLSSASSWHHPMQSETDRKTHETRNFTVLRKLRKSNTILQTFGLRDICYYKFNILLLL